MEIGSFRELDALRLQRPDQPQREPAIDRGEETAETPSFGEALEHAISTVEETNRAADKAALDYVSGRGGDLHNVMIAMEKADLTFQTMVQVRNRLLDAYREIMRMPV
jgi:flagellar hook-basal body complex protein FliE